MFNHSHIRHFSSVFVSLRDFELITQNSSENITSRQSRCIYVNDVISYDTFEFFFGDSLRTVIFSVYQKFCQCG